MRRFGALLAGILYVTILSASARAAQPNVLIFVTDDQSHPSQSMPLMPATERIFGQGGTEFTHGFVTTPQCCPSRASIFSGRYSHNTGVTHNDGTDFDARYSWERVLNGHGYYTGIIGKYLNGVDALQAPYFDFRERGQGSSDESEIASLDDAVQRFVAQAEVDDRTPWALQVSTYSPHYPWTQSAPNPLPIPPFDPPASYQEAHRGDKDPSVRAVPQPDSKHRRAYYGQQMEVQVADRELGATFDALRAAGEARNTIAFFLSDNGFFWGEHGLTGKGWPYLEAVRVPFYVRWPGHISRGARDHRLVANIDIAPTIFDATDVLADYRLDGRSLLGSSKRRWLFLEGPVVLRHPPWWSYLARDRQYIVWKDGFREGYDLNRDPWQLRADNSDRPRLDRMIEAARTCSGSSCP